MTTQAKQRHYNSLPRVNWGTSVVPVEDRIDPSKEYRTVSGKRIIGLQIVMRNSCDQEVTFPVKGSIVMCEKPFRTKYTIWTLDGRHSLFSNDDKLGLVEVQS